MFYLKNIVVTMRPKHWIKNIVVFAALIFSVTFFNLQNDIKIFVTFLLFCLLSGSAYIVNDIADREKDKTHPIKAKRPIASNQLNLLPAVISAVVFSTLSLIVGYYINTLLGLTLVLYFFINLLYSFWLKKVFLIDIFVISFGIVLRALAGAIAIQVRISPWFVISTMFLALFLALNKRKSELKLTKGSNTCTRKVLKEYTIRYLDHLIIIVTAAIIISYALYSFNSVHSDQMLWTIPFVIYGVFRYIYLTEVKNYGGQLSETLLKDIPLMIDISLWGIIVILVLVFFNNG
jgi:4-hydroxybenzoate polyprenyltransferase